MLSKRIRNTSNILSFLLFFKLLSFALIKLYLYHVIIMKIDFKSKNELDNTFSIFYDTHFKHFIYDY